MGIGGLKRLALVSYFFPPIGGAGTQRAGKLAKYLSLRNWEVEVFAGEVDSVQLPSDYSLLEDLPESLAINRSRLTGAEWVEWVVRSIQSARVRPDCVLLTMSPFSAAAAGIALSRAFPVVLDLRDPWALDGVPEYSSYFGWRLELARMRAGIRRAARVVFNTPEALKVAKGAFPQDASKFHYIPNGFDPSDFERFLPGLHPKSSKGGVDMFNIVHAGTFLSSQYLNSKGIKGRLRGLIRYSPEPILRFGRTIVPVLRALEKLQAENPSIAERVRFRHIGKPDRATLDLIERSAAKHLVEVEGYAPHQKIVQEMVNADLLYLHLHGMGGGERARIVPGKTYEYLASGTPILASVPAGDARDLLSSFENCKIVEPGDGAELASAILTAFQSPAERVSVARRFEDLSPFRRDEIAAQFDHLLSSVH